LNKKNIFGLLGAIVLVGIFYTGYKFFFLSNTNFSKPETYVYIPTGSSYADVLKIIAPDIKDIESFKLVAKIRSYDTNVFPGRFLLKKSSSSFAIVTSLRHNEPLKLAFNNQESLEKVISRVSSQIEADSTSLIKSFTDTIFMKKNGFTTESILGLFIPNTYEVKWNISPENFREKMLNEYHNFWNKTRLEKAKSLNMTPQEVTTLASIVHKETVKTDERPRVAGVYLNRLKLDMPLQADPTIIFAKKKKENNFNQIIKRVLVEDLKINSPYNTYINTGLPPGPIAMPDITAIDAVLNPEKHNYIYFCASVDKFGYHEFAATFAEHGVWAKKYREWVNNKGIKR